MPAGGGFGFHAIRTSRAQGYRLGSLSPSMPSAVAAGVSVEVLAIVMFAPTMPAANRHWSFFPTMPKALPLEPFLPPNRKKRG
jgi:hypothetical protein